MVHGIAEIFAELRRVRGYDLSGYRPSTLERRLAARMAEARCADSAEYLARLRLDPSECDRLIDTITINVSSFFRNGLVWDLLEQSALPAILDRRRQTGNRELRVWSAGCARGEEAYSIAILIHRALKCELPNWRIHVFATDIDQDALQAAQRGVYQRESLLGTRLGIIDQCFTPCSLDYRIKPSIAGMVCFSQDDLTSPSRSAPADSIFGGFDLVLCRNVLIYFSQELQNRVLEKLVQSLGPGGYLVLGESESLSDSVRARMRDVDLRNRIFQKHK